MTLSFDALDIEGLCSDDLEYKDQLLFFLLYIRVIMWLILFGIMKLMKKYTKLSYKTFFYKSRK